ncbi:MAG: PIN domain-containing protein [Acidobacteriota bacterium]
MRALLDTDVILDLLLDRAGFADSAAELWEANEQGRMDAYISAITPVNVFYIARKLKGAETARQAVGELLSTLRVCALNQADLQTAMLLGMNDFEDAVQVACAMANQIDVIITRNLTDYKNAPLPAFSPPDFLARLASG